MTAPSQSSGLPEEVAGFLFDYIDSVERLEVLLLLHANPFAWTPAAVARERRSSAMAATIDLDALTAMGLVVHERDAGHYRIHADTSLARILDRVAKTYRERRVSVISFIYTKPERPQRPASAPDPLRAFVDAFRLKDKKGEG